MYSFADWSYVFMCARNKRLILLIVDNEYKRGRVQKSLDNFKSKYDIGGRVVRIRSMDRIYEVAYTECVICDVAVISKDVLVYLRHAVSCPPEDFYLTPRSFRGLSFS